MIRADWSTETVQARDSHRSRARLLAAALCIVSAWLNACGFREENADEHLSRGSVNGVPVGVLAHHDTSVHAPKSDREPGALHGVRTAPVEGFTGPGGLPFEVTVRTTDPASANARRFGTITLQNSMRVRSPNVGQYPCTSCHLGRKMVLNDQRMADAHRNIQPVHPARVGATCSTCHSAENVEQLTLKTGEKASLDHTYRLCAQCHFVQANSWAGGAHGKRLDGWQGKRVVMGCADCHDPHNPKIESRIPFRAPQLKRPGSNTR